MVLDCFCYIGGFIINAVKFGVLKVIGVDILDIVIE